MNGSHRIFQATVNRNHPDHATALENLGIILTSAASSGKSGADVERGIDIETNGIRRQ